MKQLMENWRRFLKEGLDSRIQRQLDALLSLPDVGVAISSDASFGKSVRYVQITDAATEQYSELTYNDAIGDKKGYPHGAVDIMKTEEEQEGPCYDGWVVIGSEAGDGWGPLLYEIAIEYASSNGGGLTSDRFSVSKDAQAVWDKYAQRGGVNAQQMDANHEPGSSGVKSIRPFPNSHQMISLTIAIRRELFQRTEKTGTKTQRQKCIKKISQRRCNSFGRLGGCL